ncbi:3-dehydroquinate synthase [Phaeocystidibacter luteus]|uniref:3-dehydroquinate synthase n=1 Tax=Phaeocystidibacter luteus TaxID=911197 RepID=A0A6N6RGQ7_9FLAO|nr:3-dehydroquinate synthase [Phaeocystidibacter luteus]KAB2810293.1 3-dehydroquinate synthase [Phaeocystidibacter luteus]
MNYQKCMTFVTVNGTFFTLFMDSKMGMNFRETKFGNVYANEQALSELDSLLGLYSESESLVFFLVDENTHEKCLVRLIPELPSLGKYEILEVPAGEESKSIEVVYNLWTSLSELGADRHALLVNVGGGMITDLGGFVASTYKRGIEFAHVPTSLLGMVDASLGGKTGIDVEGAKNLVGTFASTKGVFLIPDFLETLPERDTLSGFAEMIKHALISSEDEWKRISKSNPLTLWEQPDVVRDSMKVKLDVVEDDPKEAGARKHLNFGHTFGHALESFFLDSNPENPLLHGEAIAHGMWMEVEASVMTCGLSRETANEIQALIDETYPAISIDESKYEAVLEWLKFDKKNSGGSVRFVLLEKIGKPVRDRELSEEQMLEILRIRKTRN